MCFYLTFGFLGSGFLNNCKQFDVYLKFLIYKLPSISCILLIVIFTTTNLLHVYYINIVSYETLKCEASLQHFLCKLKQKIFFNEIEYDKLYPFGSAPACIYDIPKMHKFSSSDSFPKLHLILSAIGTFNHNLACFLCDLLSTLVPNDYSCKDTFSCF